MSVDTDGPDAIGSGGPRRLTLLKLGGELLEPGDGFAAVVESIAALAAEGPLIIVHGGGREIDAETARRGVPKQAVDGLRITDAATLGAVVAVLAGTINTRLVAALVTRGVRAVGLTGVDAGIGLSTRAPAHQSVDGRLVDLGLVGQPVSNRVPMLVRDLVARGYAPAIACLGVDRDGQVLNVNADTLAAALAASCGAERLIIAGGTAGVLGRDGSTLEALDAAGIDRMIAEGSASAGMVAKLRACRDALDAGVDAIAIVGGRHAGGFATAPGTRILRAAADALEGEGAEHDHPPLPLPKHRAGEGEGGRGVRERGHTMSKTTEIRDVDAQHVVQTYRRAPIAFVRGSGARLYDAEGREYLDFLSGIGVASLGHAHQGLADALADQARTLLHTSNLYHHPLQGRLAARLASLSDLSRAFICNSGTEAVEACLKFARRYWFTQGVAGRTEFVALEHAFAGRTCGALSVTWDDHYREPFEPLVPGVTFVSPRDPAALRAAVTDRTAAIIAEPIQGEGGVRPLSRELAAAIEEACAATGTLLIADEIQCGLGRTGEPFHFPSIGLTPDLVSVGKALGGGFPVGAALLSEKIASAISYGDHGTTYGGNPLACRAALFVLDELANGLQAHVRTVGAQFERRLRAIAARYAKEVGASGAAIELRGKGLMWGLDLGRDAAPVVQHALEQGLLINRTSETVVRMLPPYVVTEQEIDRGLTILEGVLSHVLEGSHA